MTRKTRILSSLGAAAALFASALVTHQASAADSAPETVAGAGATVSIATVNGSGCAPGTTKVHASPDGSSVTVLYSDYLVWTGEGAPGATQRKNCLLSLDIDAPAGYTYAIKGLKYQGFANLESGATGLQQAEYYFQGQSSGEFVSHEFTGPYDGSLERRDSVGDLNWAPCGQERNLNVNTELRVNAGSSASEANILAMYSTEVPGTTLELAWKAC